MHERGGALAAFAIAAAALTGFELLTGKALSGGEGTTITQVSSGDSGPRTDTEKPKPTASNLNPVKGETASDAAQPLVSSAGRFRVFNAGGSTHVVVDVTGAFQQD